MLPKPSVLLFLCALGCCALSQNSADAVLAAKKPVYACPKTRTQPVFTNTTATATYTNYEIVYTTIYNATTTTLSTTTVESYAYKTSTSTQTVGTVTRFTTFHVPQTTTTTVCPAENKPPKYYPKCSNTVVVTVTIPVARTTIYPVVNETTITVTTTSTQYAHTYTSHYTITNVYVLTSFALNTETHNTTRWAHTVTITAPPFPSPTHFKLQEVSDPLLNATKDGLYAREGKYYFADSYYPSLFFDVDRASGNIFNLTQLYNTTVLGRPGFNATCGAFEFFRDVSDEYEDVHNLGYVIACPRDLDGFSYYGYPGYNDDYDYSNENLELKECYIDCFGLLRCSVGYATEWLQGFEGGIFIAEPVEEEDEAWIENQRKTYLKVVPHDG